MFRLVGALKIDHIEAEGGRCMRGSDGKLLASMRERGWGCKEHVSGIMSKGE